MPTLRDVAGLAGVSVATVSYVVNNSKQVTAKTRERVEQAIVLTGYVPNEAAQSLARQRKGRPAPPPAAVERRRSEAAPYALSGRRSGLLRALRIIRAAQPISRTELARHLEVHRSTVTDLVAALLAAGLLREESIGHDAAARSGRPRVGLSLRDNLDYIVGVGVGVRRTQVCASTPGGRLLGEVNFKTPAEPGRAMSLVRSAIERLRAALPELELSGVGVSLPGMADDGRRGLIYAPHLGWRDVAVADELRPSARAGGDSRGVEEVPVIIENDATAAAMYESRWRLRRGPGVARDDFALVRVGTGIGVGLVLGGEVFRGAGAAGGMAGEFGHMTIVAGGEPCVCGNRGCWERYASERSAVALYAGAGEVQFTEIVGRAKAGERRARAALGRVGEYLGIGIGNMMTGLGLARVVVSGRVADAWEFVREPLNEAIARSMAGRVAGLEVEPSKLAGAALGGALEVAAEHYLTNLVAQNGAA